MKVLCLFLRYGTARYRPEFERLLEWQERYLPLDTVETWIVDNALPHTAEERREGTHRLLPGDNSLREFSAWDAVLARHAHEVAEFDVIHFVTETFHTLYTKYLDHFHADLLEHVAGRSACLGHIDCYDREIALGAVRSQHWIRTCFFFLSPTTLGKLGHFVAYADEGRFFDEQGDFRPGAISRQYARYITDWLGGVPLQGVSWHSRIGDPALFRLKVLAILNEHALSIRLRHQGVRLLDYCWSWYNLLHGSTPGHLPPGWQQQLEFRRAFLAGQIISPAPATKTNPPEER